MLYFHPIVLRMWNFELITSVIGFCVTINWVESPNRAGNHIDGSWGAIKSSRATISHWFLFWLSSNRALDTKVTKSRAMMEKGKQYWGSMTAGEEHKGGSTTAQGDIITENRLLHVATIRLGGCSDGLYLPRRADPSGGCQSRGTAVSPCRTGLAVWMIGQAHLPAEGTSWTWECYTRLRSYG